ncbi:DUF1700 domain-containing protein [Faecalimonas sp.]
MNRIEFMAELERLLKAIPEEERREAIQYYEDYFVDAGVENEQHIITELESPEKVAQTIKSGLWGKEEDSSEYRETGYTDIRFEEKETPANRENREESKPKKDNSLLKILLIIAIAVFTLPIVFPLAVAGLAVIFAIAVSGFALFGTLVLLAVVVMICGFYVTICGILEIFHFPALALVVIGGGLLAFVAGLVATVLMVKVCMIVFPILSRGLVNVFRKFVNRKEIK